jgi:peptide/nickel transport system substrate-binding protein
METLLVTFSPAERLTLYVLAVLLGVSTLTLLAKANMEATVTVPTRGGALTEGITGTVRFVNPVLAMSPVDTDLTTLVYSGLMRGAPDGGTIPDLAEGYDVSSDGMRYTFHLRPDATFQDGTSVTANDVLFTVAMIQNPEVRSPRRADWEGVVASSTDAHTVIFTLPHPYAPFIENATVGILPKHLWEKVPAAEFAFSPMNTRPIGAGPYEVNNTTTDTTGVPTVFVLSPFDDFVLGSPHLSRITIQLFASDDALAAAFDSGAIDAVGGVQPAKLSQKSLQGTHVVTTTLPRTFGVFFNQSHAPVLADASVRAALEAAIDTQSLVSTVLQGYGEALHGPVAPEFLDEGIGRPMSAPATAADTARTILQKGGWTFDTKTRLWMKNRKPLSITLATADTPDLKASAEFVADAWRAAGVETDVHVYALTELNTNVIRPRAYDALLFGEVVGRTLDLFAFWHSSQRTDPGLNLALYANSKADTLLSQARTTLDRRDRDTLYRRFADILLKDHAAVFLFAPSYTYVIPDSIHGLDIERLGSPSDRFLSVYQWYTDTEQVWSFFTKQSSDTL